jgi:hypothetical protein
MNQIGKVTEAISQMGLSDSLREKLSALEAEKSILERDLGELERRGVPEPAMPSMSAIRQRAQEVLPNLVANDPEVACFMKTLVPNLVVVPYRICDGNSIVLRAHATLYLAALDERPLHGLDIPILRRELRIDLFDEPQRVSFRKEILAKHQNGLKPREIATKLSLTPTAVHNSLALSETMASLGLSDPYVRLTEATTACGLRRHLHPRYRFEPLPPA